MSKGKIGKILFWLGWIMIFLFLVIMAISLLGIHFGCIIIALVMIIIGGISYIEGD